MNILFFLSPKQDLMYVYDDFTLRQTLEKWENNRYASIPVLNRKGEYVGTLTEGDILWGLKKFHGLDLEAAEDIPIRDFAHKRDYKAVTVTTSMDQLIEAAMSQNFVPVVDDRGMFIGIVRRQALIRDQIAAITKVTAGQKVVVDPDVEMDVVALAGTPGSVCAAVLRFREGRLTDKREFLFHDTADIAAVREEFLPRYYLDDEQIPKVIAVDELPPDVDALQQALNEKRGSEVQLYVPQRGDKAHLVEMAHTNAVERLARESGRYAREEKLLDELAQVLGLPKPPRTIESYDISNWGDGTSVCGMVTFRDGKPYKAGYRKFKMKTVAGTDDYASLAETVSRRAAEYEKYSEMAANGEPSSNYFGQKPDLLLMDGGRGQVSAAKAALAGTALADVPLYGMVKDDHHRTRAIVDSEGREIAINMNRGTFTFVTAIQDETHRFANAYRKQQMKQKSYSSTLTEVPGVGPKTAKALMTQFKSVSAVKEATPDQLENTPGVGRQMAQTIYEYFHPQG